MDDIFKSKDDMEREEKINNLFKSAKEISDIKKEMPEMAPVAEPEAVVEPEKKKSKALLGILLFLLFAGLLSAVGYLFWQSKKTQRAPQAMPVVNETGNIEDKVRVFMELPEEEPTIATIIDREKFDGQQFFADALDGDKILLYIQSQKVILYRPSSNEVIGTTDLLFGESAKTETAGNMENVEKTPEKIENKVKVDVLNGTEIKGLAKETADKLSGMENVEVAKTGNAQKNDHTKIIVVDLSGKNEIAAKIIAEKLGGKVAELPAGESKGTADILVIAGK